MAKKVIMYTDGSYSQKTDYGGAGAVVFIGSRKIEVTSGFYRTTSQRMEIMGVIKGLRELCVASDITVYSDSVYVVRILNREWAYESNDDLWDYLHSLVAYYKHKVKGVWVAKSLQDEQNVLAHNLANDGRNMKCKQRDTKYKAF